MSNERKQSKLDELLRELCPDGVEYKELQEILKIKNGSDYKAYGEGDIPVYGSGGIMTYIDRYVYNKPSVLIPRKGSIDKLYYVDTPFWNVDTIFYTEINTDLAMPRYVYHCLLREHLEQYNTAGGVPTLTQKVLNKVQIPLPPLPVQREIVRILDKFTELTEALIAELTMELTARKKQYGCYRDSLLSFAGNTDVKNVPLSDIAKFVYGYTDKAKETGSVRFVRITDISEDGKLNPYDAKYVELTEESKKYLLEKGDLLLARTGATYGKTLYFEADEPAVYASFLIKIILDNSVIKNRYYWHFSKSSLYWEQAERYVSKGGQQQFNTNAVSRVKVPVPSLEVQDKIIYVLDNFDAICSDLKIGLPAEIEARKKQYEFYRDALLTYAATGIINTTDRQTDRQTDRLKV